MKYKTGTRIKVHVVRNDIVTIVEFQPLQLRVFVLFIRLKFCTEAVKVLFKNLWTKF